jgi:hypothetical protein
MKAFSSGFIALLIVYSAHAKEQTYIGSTPAGIVVKTFLGIRSTDSVDYIQWKLILRHTEYLLNCQYKIVDRTNGATKDTKKIELKGALSQDHSYYILQYQGKELKLAALNRNLLHIMKKDNSLLIGNDGWSYTISNTNPSLIENISIKAKSTVIKDSMVFVGRSPCGVPGVISKGTTCYKLKWKIVLYGNKKNEPTTCKVYGTPYRKEGGKPGTWKIITKADGKIIYQLHDVSGKPFLYLQKADENILLFTDASGKILTGDEEYSFTLNRK